MTAKTLLAGVTQFHVAPRDQGQMVEVAYGLWVHGCGGCMLVRRTTDRSTGEVEYATAAAREDEEGDFWNGAPVPASEWTAA